MNDGADAIGETSRTPALSAENSSDQTPATGTSAVADGVQSAADRVTAAAMIESSLSGPAPRTRAADVSETPVVEVHTRLLYPFIFRLPAVGHAGENQEARFGTAVDQACRMLKVRVPQRPHRPGKQSVPWIWQHPVLPSDEETRAASVPSQDAEGKDMGAHRDREKPPAVIHFYRDEMLPHVTDFLFACKGDDCRCLRVEPELANLWFEEVRMSWSEPATPRWLRRLGLPAGGSEGAGTIAPNRKIHCEVPLKLATHASIEMFISPFGIGVLSIPLMAEEMFAGFSAKGERSRLPLDLLSTQTINYRLSQLNKERRRPMLFRPQPPTGSNATQPGEATDPQPGSTSARPAVPSAPAPLESRMGIRGKHFDLRELKCYLLEPLRAAGVLLEEPQGQFSVYTVIHFASGVDFGTRRKRDDFAALLAGLAQVEESTHAPAVAGDRVVPMIRFNAKHLAAASPLGAAHLVADQHAPPFGYDLTRVQSMRDKYFIAYLMTLFQKLFFQRSQDDAAEIGVRPAIAVDHPEPAAPGAHAGSHSGCRATEPRHQLHHSERSESVPKLTRLREEIFRFAITGQFSSISMRESVNRFYVMCRRALGVNEASRALRRAVSDIESAEVARRLDRGVQSMVDTQNKVEWAEIFIISVYAVELVQHLGENFGFNERFIGGSLLAFAVATLLVAAQLLAPHKHRQITRRGLRLIVVLLLMLLGYLLIGRHFPKETPGTEGKVTQPTEHSVP